MGKLAGAVPYSSVLKFYALYKLRNASLRLGFFKIGMLSFKIIQVSVSDFLTRDSVPHLVSD